MGSVTEGGQKGRGHDTSHGVYSFKGRAGVFSLFLLLLSLKMSSVACDSTGMVVKVRKGEVVLGCPLTADIQQTKHSVIIKYFNPNNDGSSAEVVLDCGWLEREQIWKCSKSKFGAELIKIEPYHLMARLPEDFVQQTGHYRCQLVPADRDRPFTDCDLYSPEIPIDIHTTGDPSTDVDRESQPPDDSDGDRVWFVVLTTFLIFLFLLVLAGFLAAVRYLRKRRETRKSEIDRFYEKPMQHGVAMTEPEIIFL